MSIQAVRRMAILLAAFLIISLVLPASAACPETKLEVLPSAVTVDPAGTLAPGMAVVMSVRVDFPKKENTTYPETSQLELTSGLDTPVWTWNIVRNGVKKDEIEEATKWVGGLDRINQAGIPAYIINGWYDIYTRDNFLIYNNLTVPKRMLVRPVDHSQIESPGADIDFGAETHRWFDYWLKGIDTGIMAEPMLRAWMQESVEPRTFYATRPGRWIAEPGWPSAGAPNEHTMRHARISNQRPACKHHPLFHVFQNVHPIFIGHNGPALSWRAAP